MFRLANEVYIESIQALRNLNSTLVKFSSKVQDMLEKVEAEILHANNVLKQRRHYWENKIAYWEDVLQETTDDEEKDNADYAERRLEEAKRELYQVQLWEIRVEESSKIYYFHAKRLHELSEVQMPKAIAFLKQKLNDLLTYNSSFVSETSEEASMLSENYNMDGPASKTTAAASVNLKENQALPTFPVTLFALPPSFHWVPLKEIDASNLPKSTADFKKVSYEEMKKGFASLIQEVLPRIQSDPSRINGDFFRELDKQGNRDYPNGLQKIYEVFFGSDRIHLSKFKGDSYFSVDNGRHRVKIAFDMGLSAVPAEVVEVERTK